MSQLLEIKKKDLGHAEDYLTSKGWGLYKVDEPAVNHSLNSVTFSYNQKSTTKQAQSFLSFMFSKYSNKTRIFFQTHKREKYTEYINPLRVWL